MKYSQAVIVACIGSAALVSGLPHASLQRSASAPAGSIVAPAGPAQAPPVDHAKPAPAHGPAHAAREFPDEIESILARDFSEDDLQARLFEAMETRAKQSVPSTAPPAGPAAKQPAHANAGHVAREFFDEIESILARDFSEDDLQARLFEAMETRSTKAAPAAHDPAQAVPATPAPPPHQATNAPRELEGDVLEARGLRAAWNALWGKKQTQPSPPVAGAPVAGAPVAARDVLEEVYELAARAFYDEEDLIAARANIFDTLSAITRTFTPPAANAKSADKKPADKAAEKPVAEEPSTEAPAAEEPAAEPEAREYFGDFDLRDFIEIDELD